MAGVKVKLKIRGINELMKSRGVTARLVREAQRMQQAAGDNFEYNVVPHKWTARAFIRPKNAAGRKEQADSAVLERVVGSR